MEDADFSGYATKAGLKCSDGRTITAKAFEHMDGQKVPLVWQHGHSSPGNILGHAYLESREDGVYAYGFFNETEQGLTSKALVQHGDVKNLSIFANQLKETVVRGGKNVIHGMIREVSLVLSGANPGALIDQVRIAHSDDPNDFTELDDEAIIHTGLEIETDGDESSDEGTDEEGEEDSEVSHSNETVQDVFDSMTEEQQQVVAVMVGAAIEHADGDDDDPDETIQDVYESMSSKQQKVVQYMIGVALEAAADGNGKSVAQSSVSDNNEGDLAHQEGTTQMTNVFEDQGKDTKQGPTLSHDDLNSIVEKAKELGSFRAAVKDHALAHGITDIELMFPDAKMVGEVDLIKRRTEWVAAVIGGARKSPFSRIKSLGADLTADEARAKGYVKGNLKKDEIIRLLKRVTTPTTIYKKQSLDRDDVVDITEIDVVAWLKGEMRLMLEEEMARAILIGDGREADDEDKIDEDKLRPIAFDDELYTHVVTVPAGVSPEAIIESVLRARKHYKGTGTPKFYTTDDVMTDMILVKDKLNRRLYGTEAELAAALRVSEVVIVEPMEDLPDLLGVIVNMQDYTIGADKGGEVNMFDDFDIDYNKMKYLIETRASGALTKFKSAVSIRRVRGAVVVPLAPTFDEDTNTITVPATAGVEYYDVTDPLSDGVKLASGPYVISRTTDVEARPAPGNSFPDNTPKTYTYAFTA